MKVRYLPDRSFPEYVFVPGKNPHPKKPGGHMEGEKDPAVAPLNPDRPFDSDILRYSLDLYNHGYFWESHVYFEALWNAHNRQGAVADFLKAMIKLGAAGLKKKIDQEHSANGHLDRARELFQDVMGKEGEVFLGFNLKELILKLKEGQEVPEVHPLWE